MPLVVPIWTKQVWDDAFIEYVKAQRDLDRQVKAILSRAAHDAGVISQQLEGIDQVSAQVRSMLLSGTKDHLERLNDATWSRIEETVGGRVVDASDIAIQAQSNMLSKLIELGVGRGKATELARSFVEAAQTAAENVRSRLINAIPLSKDVVRNQGWALKQINDAINTGIALNQSAREIAASVVDLINPNTPGGASFAALRIGRTELNNAFHTTTTRAIADRPWVEGVKWVLSESHPRPDECNEYAETDHAGMGPGIYPNDSIPGKPHPQCLCYVTVVTVSPQHFADQLLGGKYDQFLVSHGSSPVLG